MNLVEQGITAITFDLDDTLWPCEAVITHAEQAYIDWFEQHYPVVTQHNDMAGLREKRRALLQEFPQLANDVTEWRLLGTRRLLEEHGLDVAAAEQAMDVFLHARQAVEFYDDVMDGLQDLSLHFRLGALTNGNADLQRIGASHLFDSVQYATLQLPAKPAPDMFLKAFEELGVQPQSVLHVGDNPVTDIEGARRLGCKTAWIDRGTLDYPHDAEPADINITSLHDLVMLMPGKA